MSDGINRDDFYERLRQFRGRQFAAHMMPIEQQAMVAAEERMLESWFAEELRCESIHHYTGREACSVEVTHRVTYRCIGKATLVCTVSATAEATNCARNVEHTCGTAYGVCIKVMPL